MKRLTVFSSRLLFWVVAPWAVAGILFFPWLAYKSVLVKEPTGACIASFLWLLCLLLLSGKFSTPKFGRSSGLISNSNNDERIFQVVEHATPEKPHDLVQILNYVDALDRVLLSHGELAGGLSRLIKQGRIAELPGHRYYGTVPGAGFRQFSGLTETQYLQACEAYHRTW